MRFWFLTIVVLLLAQGISAQFLCGLFRPCTTPPVEEPPAATASNSALTTDVASSSVPSVVPSPTSIVSVPPSSSVKPSAPPPSASITPPPATTLSDTSSSALPTETTPTATPSATPTPTPKADNDKDGGSNIGVIVGSVCGFVAIIGAGFAYAFFSKTRRNNRDKRLYTETGNSYPDNSYQPDHFNARPSPAIAASAVAAADQIHSGHQWDNQPYNYGNGAPQPPMATVTKQHDAYYSTAPVSQMGYSTSDTYYSNNNQQYYDPNAGAYYDPQQHHYDPNYIDSQKQQQHDLYTQQQQHDPYLQKHQSPVLNQATIVPTNNVYSAPHSYSNENNPNSYR